MIYDANEMLASLTPDTFNNTYTQQRYDEKILFMLVHASVCALKHSPTDKNQA